jgi:hypothetical protein
MVVSYFSPASYPQPSNIAVCVSVPFGNKKLLTFHDLQHALVALPSIQKKYNCLHSFVITGEFIKCKVEYSAGGSLGCIKISAVHNELDYIQLSFFTEKYSPKTGSLFQCTIYEVNGSSARFHDHELRNALSWIKRLLPKCSINESCKITSMTCDMFSVVYNIFA